jgi:hypothetical protein
MKPQSFMRIAITLALLSAGALVHPSSAKAQVLDFGQIDAFESMGTGTQRGGSTPKTIVDDSERHTVFITILEANTDAKVYWKSAEDNRPQTTIIHGPAVQAFKTAGEFRLEALGDENHSVKYGYVLLRLKK